MKHQYFGDVNDYRKYGLLRCISEATEWQLGILWLLTADDERSDGEFRGYLMDADRWRHHDASLFDRLAGLLQPGIIRSVDHASAWGLLSKASYCNHPIQDSAAHRRGFMEIASEALAHCPLLFLDPDNGVEVKSVPYGAKNSSKYVYWSEMASLFSRGHSLLVYQHYPRVPRETFEARLIQQFQAKVGGEEVVVFSTAHVAFVLVLQPQHTALLPAIRAAVQASWSNQIRARA